MTRGAALALALAATGCGAGGDVKLLLSLDESSCGVVSPDDVPLPCGGAIGLWAVEVGGAVLAERCVGFTAARTRLEEVPAILSEAGVSLDLDAGEEVVVELAIYGPGTLGCPRWTGGAEDQPLHFARSQPVRLSGQQPEIALALECLTQAAACGGADLVAASAAILDLDRLQPPGDGEVGGVAIGAVFPGQSENDEGEVDGEARLEPLGDLAGSGGAWAGTIAAIPPGSACVATVVSSEQVDFADRLNFLSCQASPSDPAGVIELMTTAYVASLEGIGPDGEILELFLAQGVVVGRVPSDPGGMPSDKVVALDPGYEVHVDGDRFIAFRPDGVTPHCCVRFGSSANEENGAVSDPVPVFPGVVTTVHLNINGP